MKGKGHGRPMYQPVLDSEDEEYFCTPYDDQRHDGEMSSISFGALSKAQNDLKDEKEFDGQQDDPKSDSDSDSALDESSVKKRHKHAPTEASSKKKVSVIRDIPGLAKTKKTSTLYTDIRFDPAYGKADLANTRKNYAFLNEYRQQEIQEMKEMLKVTKDSHDREKIKTAIQALESRLRTLANRDFEAKVLSQAPKNGKYLKRSEKKKLVLIEKFKTMKKKDIDRIIERRRKKNAAKERKTMPLKRRP